MIRCLVLALPLLLGAAAPAQPDPYAWLEQVSSPEALDWVRAQNARSLSVLQSDPRYPAFLAMTSRTSGRTHRTSKAFGAARHPRISPPLRRIGRP